MAPSATRNSRAAKPNSKSAERKSAPPKNSKAVKKTVAKASTSKGTPVGKTAVSKTEAPKKSKTLKTETAPPKPKKTLIMEAEEPKKKISRAAKPKAAAPPVDEQEKTLKVPEPELTPVPAKAGKKTRSAKSAPDIEAEKPPKAPKSRKPAPADTDDDADEPMFEERPSRSRTKMFDETPSDFIEDELAVPDDDVLVPDDIELDPLEIPLELLDPELVEVPRPSVPPKPKPKPKTDRRPQICASCGNQFGWLSVEQLCFNCLKKKLAQRKREDESYGGFAQEAEEDDSSD